jgi:lipopolysaccharide transport system ATP-binding protein
MPEDGVVVQNVWKKFHRGELHDSLRDLIPAMAKRLAGRTDSGELSEDDFWALREVSFTVAPGEALGVIGPNGAGKSTLLKVLNRILRPNRGTVSVPGRVGALIELAAGFHPDLTGAENVYLQGSIMGMRRREIAQRFEEIVDFAGLPDFMDTPVKRYSSGMNARLGFAIAAHLDVDVLLIDEVLAVGDFSFQQKAFARLRDVTRSGIPVVVVSHQLERVSEICSHAILLRSGVVEARGTPAECVDAYVRPRVDEAEPGDSTRAMRINRMEVSPSQVVDSGSRAKMLIEVACRDGASDERIDLWVRARSLKTGAVVFASNTRSLGLAMPDERSFRVRVVIQLNVPPGAYSLDCFLWDSVVMKEVHLGPTKLIQVQGGAPFLGSVQMNAKAGIVSGAST